DMVTISGDNLSAQNIIESCETLAMMSERKVVLVPDFLPADGGKIRGFGESEIKDLTEYLSKGAGVPESTLLIFTSGETEGKSKLPPVRKAIKEAKNGSIYDFQPLDDSLLRGFIEKRLKATGKGYRPSLVSSIIAESGYGNKYIDYTLYNLDNDLKKLAAYAGETEITAEDARAVISTNPENNIFSLLDSVSRNRKGDALEMLHNLFDAKVDPFMIQAMIVRQLELILYVKEMSDDGRVLQDISKIAGDLESAGRKGRSIPEFRVKKAMQVSKNISSEMIKHMLTGAYEIDGNVKRGIFEPKLALEYYISNN
ncbi:MAG: DNA polymerase III subunit delta, partial [Firmicutes bacterium]|nr:DNA polymerase III subunit delta [Bacillota bacterium]